jgi:hypothetical protein
MVMRLRSIHEDGRIGGFQSQTIRRNTEIGRADTRPIHGNTRIGCGGSQPIGKNLEIGCASQLIATFGGWVSPTSRWARLEHRESAAGIGVPLYARVQDRHPQTERGRAHLGPLYDRNRR